MAINRYRVNTKVTLAAGTWTPDVQTGTASTTPLGVGSPANFGTGSFTQGATKWGSGAGGAAGGSTTWLAGMELLLDPSGPLFTAIGSGNLTLVSSADDVGHSGLSN